MSWRSRIKRTDDDFNDEVRAHIAIEADALVASGMRRSDAEAAARRKFGNVTSAADQFREGRNVFAPTALLDDLRKAARTLARRPSFSALAIITLALGVGLTVAAFTALDATLIRKLPYRDPDQLVVGWRSFRDNPSLSQTFVTYADYDQWKREAKSFDKVGALTWIFGSRSWRSPSGERRDVLAAGTSPEFFDVLGVTAAHGRTFAEADVASGCAIVLSDGFWKSNYGANPSITGQAITLDAFSCTVLGVMPPTFAFYPDATDMWILMTPQTTPMARDPQGYPLPVFARLKRGVSIEAAQQEVAALYKARTVDSPTEQNATAIVKPLQGELTMLSSRSLRTTLITLMASAAFVLLIGCVNVANLLVGNALRRQREFAVRLSLGAGAARLTRQLLAEGLAISFAGSALGVGLAWMALRYVRSARPVALPPQATLHLDLRVVAFAVAIALITAVLASVGPAWHATKTDVVKGLRAGDSRSGRSRRERSVAFGLVGAELAVSIMLVACASLLTGSLHQLQSVPLGFRTEGLLTLRVQLPRAYRDSGRADRYFNELATKLGALPGAEAATVASSAPAIGADGVHLLAVDGDGKTDDQRAHDVATQFVRHNYFDVMNEAVRAGRSFTEADRAGANEVGLINETLAARYFPNGSPIGRRVRIAEGATEPWVTIVGVVSDEQRSVAGQEMAWTSQAVLFRPFAQGSATTAFVTLAVAADPLVLAEPARRVAFEVDREATIGDIQTMDARVARVLQYPEFRARVISVFAALSILLAAVGLYGVLAQLVAQRTREIGLRVAVGAQRLDIVKLVLRETAVMASVGLIAGIAGAVALSGLLRGLLYGVGAADPVMLATVAAVLLGTALLASAVPALRAARTDPTIALKAD